MQIGGGTGTYSSTKSGDDLIVTVGEGKITLVGAANLDTLNLDGVETDPTFLTVTTSTLATVTLDSKDEPVDASARTKAVEITSNKLTNSISDGENDSLWGDAGADKFFYAAGDGKDVIFGFDNKDTLTLDGLDFTTSYKNSALTLKVDSGSIKFMDFSATTESLPTSTAMFTNSAARNSSRNKSLEKIFPAKMFDGIFFML